MKLAAQRKRGGAKAYYAKRKRGSAKPYLEVQ